MKYHVYLQASQNKKGSGLPEPSFKIIETIIRLLPRPHQD